MADWRTVRVFISSTFRDMHAERDQLVRVVFPELRERLLPHRVYLEEIDLRWGVTREQAENDQVLDICLQKIDECRPFFLGILGERYGWVPGTIPEAMKAQYGWVQYERGKSVTELEILFGVLQLDPRMKDRSFFYFRDAEAIKDVPEHIRCSVYVETDADRILKLANLKDKIRLSGYSVFDGYPARWDPDAYDRPMKSCGRLVGLDEFGRRVCDQLWEAIRAEFALSDEPSPPATQQVDWRAQEDNEHDRFMKSRLRVYVGREGLHRELIAYAEGNEPRTCLVIGPSGAGKSTALSKFVDEYAPAHPEVFVMFHFIGASSRSASLRDLLRRLCFRLKEKFDYTDEVPEETAPLVTRWRDFLARVPAGRRVLIVIDALDQLEKVDHAKDLYWLPRDLPSHVKIVSSCILDPNTPAGEQDPVARACRYRADLRLRVEALTRDEREDIVREVPSLSAKTLDADQIRLLIENPATANPLYLRVALEELRGFGSFEQLSARIKALPCEGVDETILADVGFSPEAMRHAGDPVTAIFTQVIERLEAEVDRELVRTVLTRLATARYGLSEGELQELVTGASNAEELFPVLRQLRPYLLVRGSLIGYFHGNLLRAVQKYYLDSEDERRAAHLALAEYFDEQRDWLESREAQSDRARRLPPSVRPANLRKVDELAWQWIEASHWDGVERSLTDLDYLESKAEAGRVFDLAADFATSLECLPAHRSARHRLRLLQQALQYDISFVARHPTTLFQCFWNRCWWYDAPEAGLHYDPPLEGWPPDGPPWTSPLSERISPLLERWRAEKEEHTPGFVWLRSLRPPHLVLGTALLAVIPAATGDNVAFDPTRLRIAGGSGADAKVWDAETGGELTCCSGHEASVTNVAFDPAGQRLASGSTDHTVRVWDATSGAELACLRGHTDPIKSVVFDPTGRRIASASYDKTIRIWDATTGAELGCFSGHETGVSSVSFDPTGRRLASGCWDGVRVWDSTTSTMVDYFQQEGGEVTSVSFDAGGRRIAAASSGGTIQLWDVATGTRLACLYGHGSGERIEKSSDLYKQAVNGVAFAPHGHRLASGGGDGTVRVWDAASGAELACFRGDKTVYLGLSFDSTGRRLATQTIGGEARVWDPGGNSNQPRLHGHKSWIDTVAVDPTGRRFASASGDGTVRVWDATTGGHSHCLDGREHVVADSVFSIWTMAFDFTGQVLAGGSADGTVRVWASSTGTSLACLRGHDDQVRCVAFDSTGRLLASGSMDRTARVWDTRFDRIIGRLKGHKLACLRGHTSEVLCVAFDPTSRRIATGSDDNTTRLWNPVSGAEVSCLRGHEDKVRCVAFDCTGRLLASGSDDHTVRIWDTSTGTELACLRGHNAGVGSVAFDPTGRRLASESSWSVRVWDAATGDCLEVVAGSRDVAAIAAGADDYPWRTVARHPDVVIENVAQTVEAGWFPAFLPNAAAHPSARLWCGWCGPEHETLSFIRLEGDPKP
jgi:WD40 repeat protein